MNVGDRNILLDEYVKITITIKNIREKLNKYKKSVEKKVINASTDREQQNIISDFTESITRIKNNPEITQKFKILKQRQTELRNILTQNKDISVSSTDSAEIKDKNTDSPDDEKLIKCLQTKYKILSSKR
ncbi:MAG: hypothetical protein Dasosvirus5_12 [Dasosvirus sp.]|uniref:Uncharacterized protein n=1 Tax=Dasosvirus sp. TaxID=2487764 RepID=A0A3G4ZV87_9VIRU|nr:MAG: hypothetical protein Dasosvirus5_12 [Dasosvirus sp.]